MAKATEKTTTVKEAGKAYLAQLEATHEAREPSDSETDRADRSAQIDFVRAVLENA